MLQTNFALALMLGLMTLLNAGCEQATRARGPITADQPLQIVTTIRPVELLVRDLIDPSLHELITVAALIPPDVSPHGFEPTPSQMARLRSADVVIYNGLGLDDWAVRDLPRGTVALRFADVLGDAADHAHHHHDHEHDHDHDHDHDHGHHHDHATCDHDHGPVDEHLWLDVEYATAFASIVAAELHKSLGDEASDVIQRSLSAFISAGDEVDDAYWQALGSHVGRRIVTHHNVFSRLAERYRLGDPIVLRPVEMLEPTPGDIRRAIEAIREEGLSYIFVEPQFSAVAAQRIAEETQVRLIQVDPLGGDADSWADMMRALLAAIVEAMATDASAEASAAAISGS